MPSNSSSDICSYFSPTQSGRGVDGGRLEIIGAGKSYRSNGSKVEVLADINLQIEDGEFVAIIGFSGSGKTTLINLMAGLIKPDCGRVLFNGKPIEGPSPDRGLVFQNYSLLPWLTVRDNVALAVNSVFKGTSSAWRNGQVEKYIDMVNLTPARNKLPAELSGGMRQRVSVARALAMNPGMLLLDEPLGALDALTRATLQDEIGKIWSRDRKTVVLITNDVDEALLLANRIIPMTAGPRATLGPSIKIDIQRPRDRKELNHCSQFREIRREVFAYLKNSAEKRRSQQEQPIIALPDIQPRVFQSV